MEEQCLYSHRERDRARSTLTVSIRPHSQQGQWPVYLHLVPWQQNPDPSHKEFEALKPGDIPEGLYLSRYLSRYTHILKQNKGGYTEPKTGKDIPTQSDKPCTGCVSFLSLGKEVFQAQGYFLRGMWRLKDSVHEAALPNTFHEEFPDPWIVSVAAVLLAAPKPLTVQGQQCP